jgi:hypothetical protein
MYRYAIDAEAAFATMTRVSQYHNVKLRTLAEAVIEECTCRGRPVPSTLSAALDDLLGERPVAGSAGMSVPEGAPDVAR